MSEPVRLAGKLICASAAEADLVRHYLPEHVALSRAEAGCTAFDVSQSPEEPLVWLVTEAFVDAAAFEAHKQRTLASDWWQATKEIRRDYRVVS